MDKEKIKVGNWVRCDDGCIAKIVQVYALPDDEENLGFLCEPHVIGGVVKIAERLEDILEVGDFINGNIIKDMYVTNNDTVFESCDGYVYTGDMIQSIVTKELFESVKFEVYDNE